MKVSHLTPDLRASDRVDGFALDVLAGLSAERKAISSKYFYDDRGSELFQKISQHPDYYPTRKEYAILEKLAPELPELIGRRSLDVVELGAGDGHKTQLLLDGLLRADVTVGYYPIDISAKAMGLLAPNLRERAGLRVDGVVGDYFAGLRHVSELSSRRKLVLFLGSSIGNMDAEESLVFLRALRASLRPGDFVLTGFDQKKDVAVLNRAYNDSAGLTAQFNLNLLARINRELGADFDLHRFRHYGYYNPGVGAMESYLLSLAEQHVFVRDLRRSFRFGRCEPLHLEYSFKYLPSDIEFLARGAGFATVRHFADEQDYFVDSLWTVPVAV